MKTTLIASLIFWVLEIITGWKVFEKYGEAGWKTLIPIYRNYVEYGKVWIAPLGLVYGICYAISAAVTNPSGVMATIVIVLGIVASVLDIIFAVKKNKAFGGGVGLLILLLFLPFVGNLVIAFGSAKYQGK